MRIPLIAQDKANHLVYGALIAALLLPLLLLAHEPPLRSTLVALAVVAAIGAIKELLDRRDPAHTPELADFIATFAGGCLVALPTLVGGVR